MKTEDFFRKVETIYNWDLTDKEKSILYGMAREQTASVVLENWSLFQSRFPGHPCWEFQEWINEILLCDEEDYGKEETDGDSEI